MRKLGPPWGTTQVEQPLHQLGLTAGISSKHQLLLLLACKMLAEMRAGTFKPDDSGGDQLSKPDEFLESLVSQEIDGPTQVWGKPVDSDHEDLVNESTWCSPTADFVFEIPRPEVASESASDQSNGRVHNSDSQISDVGEEAWSSREANIISGLHTIGDGRIFRSLTGRKKLHQGRPGSHQDIVWQ